MALITLETALKAANMQRMPTSSRGEPRGGLKMDGNYDFNGDLMGFNGDLMGFYSDLMVI